MSDKSKHPRQEFVEAMNQDGKISEAETAFKTKPESTRRAVVYVCGVKEAFAELQHWSEILALAGHIVTRPETHSPASGQKAWLDLEAAKARQADWIFIVDRPGSPDLWVDAIVEVAEEASRPVFSLGELVGGLQGAVSDALKIPLRREEQDNPEE